LVLAADNSQSIDRSQVALQRQGVAAAFRSPEVIRAIQSGSLGRIGVAYLDWSSEPYTRVVIDWRIIHDKASADAFAEELLGAPPPYSRGTAIGEAIAFAASLIETNRLEGSRRSIDISGDGPNNTGKPVVEVRDEVVARGITINGLPILSDNYGMGHWGAYYGDIAGYYVNCVVGGRGAFAVPTKTFQDFAVAIRSKLVLEISDAPAPAGVIIHAAAIAKGIQLSPTEVQPPAIMRPPTGRNRVPNNGDCVSQFGGRRRF
jgi:hypothetical protein